MKIVVIGAGIFGVTAALELQARGHQVVLLERRELPAPDAASTDISKVLRMDYGADAFYLDLMARAFEGWDRWNAEWGEALYHETGVLMLSRDEMRPGGYEHDSYRLLLERGFPVERLSPDEIARRFPAWNAARYADGYFNPRGGWAESGRVVTRLADTFRSEGGEIRSGARFAGWKKHGPRILGAALAGGDMVAGDVFILAAGAWTARLHPALKDVMWPTAQDVFHFRVDDVAQYQPPHFPVYTADVARTGWYGFPAKADGTLKVANHGVGRRLDPDAPRSVREESLPHFRAFFADTFPGLVEAPLIYERVCFYADTFDGDFWIARDPDQPELVVASGGSGHGFKFAPVLGPMTADVVEGVENPDAARFAWRAAGAIRTEYARHSK